MSEKAIFELLEPGLVQNLGSHTFGREEIIEFARKFDPQPFHLSDEGAKKSHFGALCASGWHTLSVWMRLNIDNGRKELERLCGQPIPADTFGPSPGVRNLKWSSPVYVGDTITYTSTLTGKRKNPKRPGWGMMMSHSQGINQNGIVVCAMDGAVTIRTQ
ncbi:MAG: MaoC family dehydratase [Pseudomonadota bacterium]